MLLPGSSIALRKRSPVPAGQSLIGGAPPHGCGGTWGCLTEHPARRKKTDDTDAAALPPSTSYSMVSGFWAVFPQQERVGVVSGLPRILLSVISKPFPYLTPFFYLCPKCATQLRWSVARSFIMQSKTRANQARSDTHPGSTPSRRLRIPRSSDPTQGVNFFILQNSTTFPPPPAAGRSWL